MHFGKAGRWHLPSHTTSHLLVLTERRICPPGGTCTALGTREHTGMQRSETLHQQPSDLPRRTRGSPKQGTAVGLPPARTCHGCRPASHLRCGRGGHAAPSGPGRDASGERAILSPIKSPPRAGRRRSGTRLASSLGSAKSCPNGVPQG